MRHVLFCVCFLISSYVFGQSKEMCGKIYLKLDTPAFYKKGNKELMKVFLSLQSIIGRDLKVTDNIIGSMHLELTIDRSGNIIAADFGDLAVSLECKIALRNRLLKTGGWEPGKKSGKDVCSKVNHYMYFEWQW